MHRESPEIQRHRVAYPADMFSIVLTERQGPILYPGLTIARDHNQGRLLPLGFEDTASLEGTSIPTIETTHRLLSWVDEIANFEDDGVINNPEGSPRRIGSMLFNAFTLERRVAENMVCDIGTGHLPAPNSTRVAILGIRIVNYSGKVEPVKVFEDAQWAGQQLGTDWIGFGFLRYCKGGCGNKMRIVDFAKRVSVGYSYDGERIRNVTA